MSRRFLLVLAAIAGFVPSAHGQMTTPSTSAAVDAIAPASDDIATLKAQNAALKKEVSDAQTTITQLQAKLAQAGVTPTTTTPDAAAPSGPQKALPLDSTNFVATPSAPGAPAADAGPSKTYTVVKGDKIWTIAKKMYPGHTKEGVDKIQEANKDALGTKPLKIGQVLIIPQ